MNARRKAILEYLRKYVAEYGYPPSIREINVAVGLHSTNTVVMHLQTLEREGFIKVTPYISRGIALVKS